MRRADRIRREQWDATPSVQAARAAGKCAAKTRSGGVCQQAGNGSGGRCKYHGGRSAGNGFWTQAGARATSLLTLRAALQARLYDTTAPLGSVDRDLAVLEVARDRALEKADLEESTAYRERALLLFGRAEDARQAGDEVALATAMADLGAHLERGAKAEQAMTEAVGLAERHARVALAARQTTAQESGRVPVHAFEDFVGLVLQIVASRVSMDHMAQVYAGVYEVYGKAPPAARPLAEVAEEAVDAQLIEREPGRG